MAVKPIPEGYSTVTPSLTVEGADKAIDFMKQVFGAKERMRMNMPDGKVAHAELMIGDSMVMLGDATPQWPANPGALHLYVPNCDEVYQKALKAGAKSLMEPADQFYGDRSSAVEGPGGTRWSISTHVEDVSDEETMERMKKQMATA